MLLAIPALRALRRQRPDQPLIVAAQPRIGRLLEILSIADRSIDFERLGLDALFAAESDTPDDEWPARCAEDLRRATRVIAWVGSREPGFVRRLTALVPGSIVAPSVEATGPVWKHLVETVGACAPDSALRRPVLAPASLTDNARGELLRLGWKANDRLLVVHPGAGGIAKRWSGFGVVLEWLAELPRLGIVVHQGPADAEAVARLPKPLIARAMVLREPALPLLAGVLSLATAYLGNDSGISHLAAALGTRGVVLFGAEQLAWRPWAKHVEPFVVSLATPDDSDARVSDELARLLA